MRSLQETLERCSGVDIERVARLWGVTEAVPPLVWARHFLGQTMRSREHARFVWERLSADERVVLYQVLQTRGKACGITREDLIEGTGLDAAIPAAALARLASCLLVLEDTGPAPPGRGRSSGEHGQPAKARGGIIFAIEEAASSLAETGEELFGGGDPTTRSLADMLRPLCRVHLAHTAQAHRLSSDGGGASAGDLSRSPAEALCAPLVILSPLRGIDPSLYRLCFWLYDQGGRATMQAVRAYTYTGSNGSALEWLLRSLSGMALAFDTLSPDGERLLFMPSEVYAALRRDLDACAAALATLHELGLVALAGREGTHRTNQSPFS
jgi:hypothetical protein